MTTSIINKTIAKFRINSLVRTWADKNQGIAKSFGSDLAEKDQQKLRDLMHSCLSPKGGEFSARSRIITLASIYLNLSNKGKLRFLSILTREFNLDSDLIKQNIECYQNNQGPENLCVIENTLLKLLESPRAKILKLFSALQNGIKFLVDMREDVLRFKNEHKALTPLDYDLHNILVSWFDLGLLDLRRITWDSPASLLEKLIYYEAVHEIKSWNDLRNRLASDRLCFAAFHYKMPDEPLIFVEVAFTQGTATNIQALLDEQIPAIDARLADTAVFYSISNTQKGLQSISFGNFLIKSAVNEISKQYRNIINFITLSPIPGFCKWLQNQIVDESIIESNINTKMISDILNAQNNVDIINKLMQVDWCQEDRLSNLLKEPLLKLCANYLLHGRRNGLAADAVAHFHLSNGASIASINWLADNSSKGIKQSFGIMVNYYYDLDKIEENHEVYMSGSEIKYSKEVKNILGKKIKYN
jgi:malonyl-CoA decarboxylase